MQTNTRAKVSNDQINQAIEQLNSEGIKPTIRAVRERLGAGSPNRIQPLLAAWHDKQKPAQQEKAVLSDNAQQALAELFARERSAAVAAKLEEITELKSQLTEVTQAGQQLEDENERLELLNIKLDEQQSEAVTLASARQQRIEQLEEDNKNLQVQSNEFSQQLATAQAKLAMQQQQSQQQQQRIDKQAAELDAARQQTNAAQAQQAAAVAEAKQTAAVAEAKLDAATATAAAAAKRIERLEQQLEQTQKRADDAQAQRNTDAQQHIQQLMTEQQKNKELAEKLEATEKKQTAVKPAAKAKKPVQRPPASKLRRHLTNKEIILLTEDLKTLKAKPETERSTFDNSEIKKLEKQLALSPPPPSQS